MYLCELHERKPWSHHLICLITYVHSFAGCCFEIINYKRKEREKQEAGSSTNSIRSLKRTHSLTPSLLFTHAVAHSPSACSSVALRCHCPALGLSRAPALSSQPVWLTHSLSPFRFAPDPAPDPDQSHRLHILLSPSPNRGRRPSCESEKGAWTKTGEDGRRDLNTDS